jgi:hypothetical protein
VPVSMSISKQENNNCVNIPTMDNGTTQLLPVGESKKAFYLKFFMRYGFLSVEFFLFFFILLSITKPSFLYYNQRVIQNGRELLRTHFSVLYLFSYSLFFTCIFHVLILVQQDLVKRY